MKIITKSEQQMLLDFICEQYLVAVKSYAKGALKINNFTAIQTQAYNAARAAAGNRGLRVLQMRRQEMEVDSSPEHNDKK